jgi:hypothetical protein
MHKWADIKMNLWEIGVNWMHLIQDRNQWWAVVKAVMNLHIP